ncbi:MAG: hypothetical protein ACREYE_31645 [Gammaproteobacteria bacterium]
MKAGEPPASCDRATATTLEAAVDHAPKGQYEWVASPYPTGTFTLQDAPSFSQRENASVHRLARAARSDAYPGSVQLMVGRHIGLPMDDWTFTEERNH